MSKRCQWASFDRQLSRLHYRRAGTKDGGGGGRQILPSTCNWQHRMLAEIIHFDSEGGGGGGRDGGWPGGGVQSGRKLNRFPLKNNNRLIRYCGRIFSAVDALMRSGRTQRHLWASLRPIYQRDREAGKVGGRGGWREGNNDPIIY